MQGEKLLHMANQIATYFQSYPDADAATGVAKHLKAFWTAKMRETLVQHLSETQDGASPLVIRAMWHPNEGHTPIRKAIPNSEMGELNSDAG